MNPLKIYPITPSLSSLTLTEKIDIESISKLLSEEFKNNNPNVRCTLAILQHGKNPLEKPIPISSGRKELEDSPQHFGSVSKQFTAACIVKLVEQGKLNWDDDIIEYLPLLKEFKIDESVKKVTIDDLLHMRSGLPELNALAALTGQRDPSMSAEEKITLLSKFPYLNFNPGSTERYCNTNYFLLAEIVSKVSEKPFVDFVRDNIFAPLNMESRFISDPQCLKSIDGYNIEGERNTFQSKTLGAVGVVGKPSDMVKWNASLDRNEQKELLERPKHSTVEEGSSVYCRGLKVAVKGNYRIIYHTGSVEGFSLRFMRYEHMKDPNKNFAFFIAANVLDTPTVIDLSEKIAKLLTSEDIEINKEEDTKPPPKTSNISKKECADFEGTFEDTAFNLKYQMEARNENDTFVLDLFLIRDKKEPLKIVTFKPVKDLNKNLTFFGPIGDFLQKTPTGFILLNAGIAPFHFNRIN